MCGRFAQISRLKEVLEELARRLEQEEVNDNLTGRYNIAPQSMVKILRVNDQKVIVDNVHWGWKPFWAKDMQPPINARIEKVASSKFYSQIWPHRCLIPANGWYEWVKEGSSKQPYYIHLKTNKPMFFAGIGHFKENSDNNGFVIITADSQGGMIDIYDRRPVVLTPEYANEWIDSNTTLTRAEKIINDHYRKPKDFDWYKVSEAVGNVRNQGKELIKPIDSE
ncbi:SOS response-associated peptidase family protein [Entomomonas asaccharolytica]|uniref:Abasic site processing protein n=1 Tax=Entomomonas asaccharolytica TaxID=2785331 RepID=A0A974NHS7_9GAMM|nr:SOS response-associated peptidase family protein [Entomomonas asaccharolytica]QQP86798.1 SOS response-associated peptidase family protein [Entomomonas asaccharolytica]